MNERPTAILSASGTGCPGFRDAAGQIAQIASEFAARGWTPATSSNFSMRLDAGHLAITVSGRDKGALAPADIMVIDMQARAVDSTAKPSAEAALHAQIYRQFPQVDAVLHTHSRTQTVASRLFAASGAVRLSGYELLKAFASQASHDATMEIPVFPNSQDMQELEARVDAWLRSGKPLHAYLIEGHGIYTWGRDMDEAKRHLEALEFMLACELDLKRLGA
ncbi:MAG: methylthioribulose 1-phosphate dehydratase [Proteobacteria bacterium]|nr:methylthioribulose 1-phosphate dehydratase [Pseudomonadota bacterium]